MDEYERNRKMRKELDADNLRIIHEREAAKRGNEEEFKGGPSL